jgi:hypothetical protein
VRRLKSFRRALKSFSETGGPVKIEAQRHQLSGSGMFSSWPRGLAANGLPGFWPLNLSLLCRYPSRVVTFLDLCIDITEMHCNTVCRQEVSARRDCFRHRIKVDHDEGFLSLSYRIIRGNPAPPLNEVPFELPSPACLIRSRKGESFIRVSDKTQFRCESHAVFGDAVVKLIAQSEDKISIWCNPCQRGATSRTYRYDHL